MEPPEELAAAVLQHGEALMNELQCLAELPQARLLPGSIFDTAKPLGTVPQLRGVVVRLRCCKKPFNVKCNGLEGEKACPSHVEAARALRAKIVRDHSSPACLEKARLALAEEEGEAGSSTAPSSNAFLEMARATAAQALVQKARVAVARAEARKSLAQQELSAALAEVDQASAAILNEGQCDESPNFAHSYLRRHTRNYAHLSQSGNGLRVERVQPQLCTLLITSSIVVMVCQRGLPWRVKL
jgi:hypothetical protein